MFSGRIVGSKFQLTVAQALLPRPDSSGRRKAPATRSPALHEVVGVGGFVPQNLLLVLERKRGHVAGNGRLLSHRRRRDGLLVAQHRLDEIAEVVDGAVGFVEILLAVDRKSVV